MYGPGPYDHSWMFGGGMLFGGLGMILVWAIPVLLIFALVKYLLAKPRQDGHPPSAHQETALEILQKAYARGDISREEYLAKRDDLLGKTTD